jgi:hypothetical protein
MHSSKKDHAMKRLRPAVAFSILTCFLISMIAFGAASADVPWGAVCRVRSDAGVGSGVCFTQADGWSYALTNAHVLAPENSAVADTNPTIEFWRNGHASGEADAETVSSHPGYDVAVVRVYTADWPTRPDIIPLVADVPAGDGLTVLGCAAGNWPTAYQGRRLTGLPGGRLPFYPPPAQGRSGGPLLLADGTGVVGLVQLQVTEKDAPGIAGTSRGEAVPSHIIVAVLNGGQASGNWTLTQCGPEGCPDPGGSGFEIGGNLGIGRYGQPPARQFGIGNEINNQYTAPTPIYPTLPPPVPTSPASPTTTPYDMEPIRAWMAQAEQVTGANTTAIGNIIPRVERIESDLGIIVGSATGANAAAQGAETKADAAMLAAQDATAKADETAGVIPGIIEEATSGVKSGAISAVKAWIVGLVSTFGPWSIAGAALAIWLGSRKVKSMIDTDGNGKISREELAAAAKSILDRNGDDNVNAKDLLHLASLGQLGKAK